MAALGPPGPLAVLWGASERAGAGRVPRASQAAMDACPSPAESAKPSDAHTALPPGTPVAAGAPHLSPLSVAAATRDHLRQEPRAGNPHAGICAGGAEQSASLPRPPYLLIVPNTGALYNSRIRIIALKTLRLFWEQHPDARQALQAWYRDTNRATWTMPADISNVYRNASFVGNNRVVFNIRGNQYRLVVAINYAHSIVYIRFIGSHQDYDKIDAATI
jgi:mRNA interferase HigB